MRGLRIFVFLFVLIPFIVYGEEKIFFFDFKSLKEPYTGSILHKSASNSGVYIPLPNGERVLIKRKEIEYRKDGFTVYGTVNDDLESFVIITVEKNIAYGKIKLGNKEYNIEPLSPEKGIYKIEDISNKEYVILGEDFIPVFANFEENFFIRPKSLRKEDGSVVNVLLLYTSEMERSYGSKIEAKLRYFVDLGNTVLRNSRINTRLNIVSIEKFDTADTNESTDITFALSNLAASTYVNELRDRYGADIVTLFRVYKGGGACGLGYTPIGLPENLDIYFDYLVVELAKSAFNVVEVGAYGKYYCLDYTYIHEVGHNFGCQHDRDNAGRGGAYSYSYGYDIPGIFATVMSYKSPTIPYFSNPNISYKGYPIGIPEGEYGEADNSKTINKTRILVANYRTPSSSSDNQNQEPYITVNPSNIDFGNVSVGNTVSKSLNITNTGDGTLNISAIRLSGNRDFFVKNNCTGKSLKNGEICQIEVQFAPVSAGIKQGYITVISNATNNSSLKINIKGVGIDKEPPSILVSRRILNFGKVENRSEATKILFLENTSKDSDLSISLDIPNSEDFEISSSCKNILAPYRRCSIDVKFAPKSVGIKTYKFFIRTNDPDNREIEITAQGESIPRPGKLSVDRSFLDFGEVYIGEEKRESLVLKNEGDETLNIESIEADTDRFGVYGTCSSLEGGASCSVEIFFKPDKEGIEEGKLIIRDQKGATFISLRGKGIEKPKPKMYIAKKVLDFGDVFIKQKKEEEVYIENKGNTDLIISSLEISNNRFSVVSSCEKIKSRESCLIKITFSPDKEGIFTGELVIRTNDPVSPVYKLDLKGRGKKTKRPVLTLENTNLNLGTILYGSSRKKFLYLKNTGSAVLKVLDVYSDDKNIKVKKQCDFIEPGRSCSIQVSAFGNKKGEFTSILYIRTNDPDKNVVEITVNYRVIDLPKPILQGLPKKVGFGKVYLGDESQKLINVNNIGSASLEINQVYVQDNDNFYVEHTCNTVLPGESCSIKIGFLPKDLGELDSKLFLVTNVGTYVVSLEGKSFMKEPNISLSSKKINFGYVLTENSKTKVIYITNTGKNVINIERIDISNTEDFSINENCLQGLKPNEKCQIDVTFHPKSEGEKRAKVEMKFKYTENLIEVNVFGRGLYINENKLDIDNDGTISESDLELAVDKVIHKKASKQLDLNKDNDIDISDIILLLRKLKDRR